MALPPAIEIARQAKLRPIDEIAGQMGIPPSLLEHYGANVAKINLDAVGTLADRPKARYVVVTAITPTPLGEGKTTTTVGLGQALACLGKQATIAIRQASMGPTFGIKGGAAGGGYSQVVPFENLNLHLTGDLHAVTAANNLLAAMVDNHLQQGNARNIDPRGITWRRVLDVNDRSLRNIVSGLGTREDGTPRETGFDITAASEVMAVLALATSLQDLRARFGRIVVGYTAGGDPVTAEDLKAAGAMTVIMRDAIKPNLLQTLENTPVLVHAGPFGNIAHGNSSVVADLIGIHAGEYLITEAGFGSDMGAERFFNIKCRTSGLVPDAAVVVATVRALKLHSGRHKVTAGDPCLPRCWRRTPKRSISARPTCSSISRSFVGTASRRLSPSMPSLRISPPSTKRSGRSRRESASAPPCAHTSSTGARVRSSWRRRSSEAAEEPSDFRMLYEDERDPAPEGRDHRHEVYGADGVDYLPLAARQIDTYEQAGFGTLPVCIAKTHLSISSDPSLKGAPTGWRLPVREARANVGAGFVYLVSGDMRTMPGLSSSPAAERIDIDDEGNVVGLY